MIEASSGTYMGLKIYVNSAMTLDVFRWPITNRSKRLIKKMTKKYGEQVWKKPVVARTPQGLYIHPEIYARLRNVVAQNTRKLHDFSCLQV